MTEQDHSEPGEVPLAIPVEPIHPDPDNDQSIFKGSDPLEKETADQPHLGEER